MKAHGLAGLGKVATPALIVAALFAGCALGLALGIAPLALLLSQIPVVLLVGWLLRQCKADRHLVDATEGVQQGGAGQDAELLEGVKQQEFYPYYQPIVDAEKACCVGVEVLARWKRPDGGTLSPAAFIGRAEQSGLIIQLTRRLIRRVVRDLRQVLLPSGFLLCLNVSPQHFESDDLLDDCRWILRSLADKRILLVLEIDEKNPPQDTPKARELISKLRAEGVLFALDDAWAHGKRSWLHDVGLDYFKVDHEVVTTANRSGFNASGQETFDKLVRELGVTVVVKGIETAGQQSLFNSRGYSLLQGFFFGKPMSVKHFWRWLYAELGHDRPATSEPVRPAS